MKKIFWIKLTILLISFSNTHIKKPTNCNPFLNPWEYIIYYSKINELNEEIDSETKHEIDIARHRLNNIIHTSRKIIFKNFVAINMAKLNEFIKNFIAITDIYNIHNIELILENIISAKNNFERYWNVFIKNIDKILSNPLDQKKNEVKEKSNITKIQYKPLLFNAQYSIEQSKFKLNIENIFQNSQTIKQSIYELQLLSKHIEFTDESQEIIFLIFLTIHIVKFHNKINELSSKNITIAQFINPFPFNPIFEQMSEEIWQKINYFNETLTSSQFKLISSSNSFNTLHSNNSVLSV